MENVKRKEVLIGMKDDIFFSSLYMLSAIVMEKSFFMKIISFLIQDTFTRFSSSDERERDEFYYSENVLGSV